MARTAAAAVRMIGRKRRTVASTMASAGSLPARMSWQYSKLERWGFPILLLLMFSGYLGVILAPMIRTSFNIIGTVFRF